jgi:16S rRNA (cytosine1402-N4)-methyltransferase
MSEYHAPVLVDEVVGLLAPANGQLLFDGTVGAGGHSLAILDACPGCRLVAVDRDPEALNEARRTLRTHGHRVRFIRARFDEAASDPEIRDRGLDGALLDLGVSSHQLDADDRGFAFRRGVVLDMRMDPELPADAGSLLNEADEDRLRQVFREYGEELRARRLAREVVKRRRTEPFRTSDQLVAAMGTARGAGARAACSQGRAQCRGRARRHRLSLSGGSHREARVPGVESSVHLPV